MLLDLIEASGTDALTVKENDIVGVVAENAGGMIFLKDDAVIVGEDLDRVLYLDVHRLADLDGENNSAQLVNFSDHTCRFHNWVCPFICYSNCLNVEIDRNNSTDLVWFYYKLPKFNCQWVNLEIHNLFTNEKNEVS